MTFAGKPAPRLLGTLAISGVVHGNTITCISKAVGNCDADPARGPHGENVSHFFQPIQ